RIREAMSDNTLADFGSNGGMVEADETYMVKVKGHGKGAHLGKKRKIVSLIDRDTKRARSVVVDDVNVATLKGVLETNISREAQLMTDGAGHYVKIGKGFAAHHSVNHYQGEYVRKGNPAIHTNTVENYFSTFKRGMKGTYQHCAHHHLHRYLAEFDFRYSNRTAAGVEDAERADILLSGVVGKRLTY